MSKYVCESDLPCGQIKAGIADGTMTYWRVDRFGRTWFKIAAGSMIRGVPPGVGDVAAPDNRLAADDDAHDDDEDFDVETLDRARALKIYSKLVEARAAGADVDPQLGARVLAQADKSMDDFNDDVQSLLDIQREIDEIDGN